jgi:hypothetical protein
MSTPKRQTEAMDRFDRRIQELCQRFEHIDRGLGGLAYALDPYLGRQKRRQRSRFGPLELLESLIDMGLQIIERAIGWLVGRGMGYIQGLGRKA